LIHVEQILSADEQRALLVEIGKLVRAHQPDPAGPAGVGFAQVGTHTEVRLRNTTAGPELTERFSTLRSGMYQQGRGTWLQSRFVLAPDSTFDFDFFTDEDPQWTTTPGAEAYADELATFPRDDEHIPDWWRLRTGLPLGVVFRRARPAEAGEDREPLPDDELPLVLQYLEREPLVGNGHRTDGTWLWPETVSQQLRAGVAPEPELVAHIRSLGFQPPYVEHLVRRTAEADLLGKPRPRPGPTDVQRTAGDQAAELETVADPELTDDQLITVLEGRLESFGVWPQAYRIGSREPGKWCLEPAGHGWTVTSTTGVEQRFAHLASAAQQLLGALLLHPARMTAGRETPLETARVLDDWPIQAAPGDPPLTLLRNKRLTRLAEGTVVLRFGEEPGNLVHHGEVRFVTTSLPLERERVARTYRLRRSLHVITGVTVPWANLPGGAVAYVLPKPISEHESDGSLERIE
jgi:hypothetical protein